MLSIRLTNAELQIEEGMHAFVADYNHILLSTCTVTSFVQLVLTLSSSSLTSAFDVSLMTSD